MLCRVANSVYWMSRYVERAENVARFVDVNHNLTLGMGEAFHEQWSPLVYTTGDHQLFESLYPQHTRANVLQFLAFNKGNPNSIISCLYKARENARTIREVISSQMWEELNKFYHMVRVEAGVPAVLDEPHEFWDRVRRASDLLVGVTDTTMSHGEAWHFSRIGRLIERADKTSRIVDVQYFILLPDPRDIGSTLDVVRWSALLKSTSAWEMYRRQHGRILPANVADFLVLDRRFPRSMHYCLIKAHESLQEITGSANGTFQTRSEQWMGRVRSQMDYTSVHDLIDQGLHEYIDTFQTQLNRIGAAIDEEFFTANHLRFAMMFQDVRS